MIESPGGSNVHASGLPVPGPPSPLVGRDAELGALQQSLQRGSRLVSLSGPPGIGKTRLAIEYTVAERAAGRPVAFLRLSAVSDPVLLEQMLSSACSIDGWTDLPVSRLPEWASGLLVLDGLDYVKDADAIIVTLLHRCPELRVIVTRRAALGLGEEHVLRLGPLTLDANAGGPGAATELFLSRSGLDRVEESYVAATGGNPLALELLAAHALIDGLSSLETAMGAWVSLNDVVRGCIAPLPTELQLLLRRLAALAGGFTLEAAGAVARPAGVARVEEAIDHLVERVLVDEVYGSFPRRSFEFPTAVREVALAQLLEAGELAETRRAHARHISERADDMRGNLSGEKRAMVLAGFDLEQPALQLAFDTLLNSRADYLTRRMAVAIWPCWLLTRRYREARRYLNAAIGLADPTQPDELQQELQAASALIELLAGHPNAARGRASAAAQPGSREPGTFWRGVSLATLGLVVARNGDPGLAIGYYRIFFEASSAKRSPNGWASTLRALFEIALSSAHFARGEIEDAEYRTNLAYTQSLRESDRLLAGYARVNLAAIATAKRAWIEALEMYRDGLPLLLERPHAGAVACGLAGLANLGVQLETFSTARELIASSRMLAAAGTPHPPNLICFDLDQLASRLPAPGKLSISAGDSSPPHTRWIDIQPAVDKAIDAMLDKLRPETPSKGRRAPDALTRRELEVLCLAAEGMTDREIADALFIAYRTATDHLTKIFGKLGVNNRAGAIARAFREGWCS